MEQHPAQQTFIAESHELLAEMEIALLKLEQNPDDEEAIYAVFRAAHTIKGSAGVFGFDDIVPFTHVMENLLEEIRSGNLKVNADMIALLLSCGDHVSALLQQIAGHDMPLDPALVSEGDELIARLKSYLGEDKTGMPQDPEDDFGFFTEPDSIVASKAWHISLRFGSNVLRNGTDPLSLLRYVDSLGKIIYVTTILDGMPEAELMDPESCHIGLEIDFLGDIDKNALDSAFDFIRDDSLIRILPPHSKVKDYIALISDLPENKQKLGEILVASGALTQNELEAGLQEQKQIEAGTTDAQEPEDRPKLGEILVSQRVVQDEVVDAALKKQSPLKERRGSETSFMRVRSDKLDELITLVGELVIAGAGTRLQAQMTGNSNLIESTFVLEQLVELIRDRALNLRMIPIGETFNRFNRVVRDLSNELSKKVELVISGSETELDKSMVDKIGDPLVHLVRNALDHGIEPPEIRRERGKSETGKLYLNAYHDSGSIVIEVGDDGGGLDRNRILAKAVQHGLASADQQLSDQDIFKFIMEPGFSTAASVTSVSGRGVGMDVVRRNVESLRGTIMIDSIPEKGTTMSIRLPLTLAIIDGFLVEVGDASYVIPLDMVVECLELSEKDRANIGASGYINLRDEVLPLLRLRNTFEIRQEAGKRENIVVVRYAGMQAGLVVDTLLGESQTVIKPLGKLFEKLSGISGSTILGTGKVALILDVPALVQKAVNASLEHDLATAPEQQSQPKPT